MSSVGRDACRWCGERPWTFSCAMCDPRTTKRMCGRCMNLWHSRGYSREHLLSNRLGQALPYRAWASMDVLPALAKENGAAATVASGGADRETVQVVASNGVPATVRMAQPQLMESNREAKGPEETTKDEVVEDVSMGAEADFNEPDIADEESKEKESTAQTNRLEEMQQNQVANATAALAISNSRTSPERKGEQEEKTGERQTAEPTGVTAFSKTSTLTAESASSTTQQQVEVNENHERQEVKQADAVSAAMLQSTDLATSAVPTAVPNVVPAAIAVPEAKTNAAPAVDAPFAETQNGESSSVLDEKAPAKKSQPTLADLDKLLRWFPTEDRALLEMLAELIEKALLYEDALLCARTGKCKDPVCRSTLKHYEHCKKDQVCADPKCSEIAIVYRHRRMCQQKQQHAPAAGDGKNPVCPFCIRISQRRKLGAIAAMEHIISEQRRLLRDPRSTQSEANRNFCLQSIGTCTDRKQLYRAEVERLNALASESSAPVFNFPRYNWHFNDAVAIKREPTPVVASRGEGTEPSEPLPEKNSNASSTAEGDLNDFVEASPFTQEEAHTSYSPDDESAEQSNETQDDSAPGNPKFNGDFIGSLLRDKSKIEPGQQAQQKFDKAMDLGYAIVDASFCAPAKAQRCLLNCQFILVHLQHHLDLQVCKQNMCTAVEHHFAHLSQCKARKESSSCEYCLRVQEREFARAVDLMEADQPEAEARVQSIINAITTSFTNDPPEEREQTILQLEDELDQAEDDKRELADKLNTARANLRKVRKSLDSRGMTTAGSCRLPLHFIKVKHGDAGVSTKKRRVDTID